MSTKMVRWTMGCNTLSIGFGTVQCWHKTHTSHASSNAPQHTFCAAAASAAKANKIQAYLLRCCLKRVLLADAQQVGGLWAQYSSENALEASLLPWYTYRSYDFYRRCLLSMSSRCEVDIPAEATRTAKTSSWRGQGEALALSCSWNRRWWAGVPV